MTTLSSRVSSADDVVWYIVAVIIPPVSVFAKRGITLQFWINIVLWIWGWIPGVIHALYIVATTGRRARRSAGTQPIEPIPMEPLRPRDEVQPPHYDAAVTGTYKGPSYPKDSKRM